MRVIQIDPHSDPRWERYLAEHPEGTIYHHPAWIRALEMEYGQMGLHLACEDPGGSLRAILPLLYTQGLPFQKGSRLYGRRLSSLPRTPIAGPLYTDVEAGRAVLEQAVRELGGNGGIQLQIKTQRNELDCSADGLVCVPWRLSHVLSLDRSRDQGHLVPDGDHRSSIRRAVAKATKNGVVARVAESKEDLADWYKLYLSCMRRNAVPPRSFRFISTLWELLHPQEMIQLILAEHKTPGGLQIIAGTLFLMYSGTVSGAFTGSNRRDLNLCPNDLIIWHAINKARQAGFRTFDFGETPEGKDGVSRFKSKWGAFPVRLYRYYYPSLPGREGKIDRSGRYSPAVIESIWRRLPLKATELLGDQVYRFL